jgi:hypothetical protein
MKAAENIMAEDCGESLRKHIAKLEAENSRLKTTATEFIEAIDTLQCTMYSGIKDYNLL